MKKFFALVLVVMMVMTSCSKQEPEYKYAEAWDTSLVTEVHYDPSDDLYAHSIDADFASIKPIQNLVADAFAGHAEFDWDNFNSLNNLRVIGANSLEEIQGLPEEFVKTVVNNVAMYDGKRNIIYLFPAYFEVETDTRIHTIIHEMIHALISSGHENYSRLEEGVVDFLAVALQNANGLNARPAYIGEMLAAQWLIKCYDEATVVKATINGSLDSLVEDATKPGMAKKLSHALALAHNNYSDNASKLAEMINVEYDILAHLAKNLGRTQEVTATLQLAQDIYADLDAKLDMEYFRRIIK